MTTTILARVRRVMRGHSDRALIVAVNEAGLEQKIEVPLEAVRDLEDGDEHVLMLTWSLHALPPVFRPEAPPASPTAGDTTAGAPATAASTSTPATTGAPRPSPGAVDEQFMSLMSRRGPVTAPPPPPTGLVTSPGESPAPRPAEQLAALLGIGRAPS